MCVGVCGPVVSRHIKRVGASVANGLPDSPKVLVTADHRPVGAFEHILEIAEIGQMGDSLIGGEDHGCTPFAFRSFGTEGLYLPLVF